jgi:hypothetical protein
LTAEIGWRLKGLNLPLFKGITILISWNNYLKKDTIERQNLLKTGDD